jgi:hypothetical protein
MSQMVLWLLFPLLGSYFFAHSFIWYAGMMGSHGLIRVFMVVAPASALAAQFALHRIMTLDIRVLNQSLKVITAVLCAIIAYSGAGFPFPHTGEATIQAYQGKSYWFEALDSIEKQGYSSYVLVHQIPELNVHLDLDPFEDPQKIQQSRTQYLWSLDTREGYDWFPENTIILWDNFHGRRDAPMPLDSLRALGTYTERFHLVHPEDSIYDVRVFVKNGFLPKQ